MCPARESQMKGPSSEQGMCSLREGGRGPKDLESQCFTKTGTTEVKQRREWREFQTD